MVGCLILSDKHNNKHAREMVIQIMLSEKDYEIKSHTDEKTVLFVWNVSRMFIWQCVFDLEYSSYKVGYGFGQVKIEAEREARTLLQKREGYLIY